MAKPWSDLISITRSSISFVRSSSSDAHRSIGCKLIIDCRIEFLARLEWAEKKDEIVSTFERYNLLEVGLNRRFDSLFLFDKEVCFLERFLIVKSNDTTVESSILRRLFACCLS